MASYKTKTGDALEKLNTAGRLHGIHVTPADNGVSVAYHHDNLDNDQTKVYDKDDLTPFLADLQDALGKHFGSRKPSKKVAKKKPPKYAMPPVGNGGNVEPGGA
ncbi:MAG: hypothetical protein KGI66_03510 [Patescibacteria group bacterium]|nr:hypothetical protein [Patescibacteria group bacterium]